MTDQPMATLQQLENEFSRVAFDAKDKGRYGQSWTIDAAERAEEIHRQVVALRANEKAVRLD